jgi:hypothetical protein
LKERQPKEIACSRILLAQLINVGLYVFEDKIIPNVGRSVQHFVCAAAHTAMTTAVGTPFEKVENSGPAPKDRQEQER